ncbi:MAG TPA: cytochrome c oxidase subunit II [Gemmataceae bacterium]|nr:cytochrome c oxidase subunit II [Gemmataceae bacterium]
MRILKSAVPIFCTAAAARANSAGEPLSPTNIFAPASTPADTISGLSLLVLTITGAMFVIVLCLLLWAVVKFREKAGAGPGEPAQVYGSTQVELAWTVIPVLIVTILLLATARAIASIQNAIPPPGAVEVSVIGHQYWWEYHYKKSNVVTANELHVPVSSPVHPTPTFLSLFSADTDHSFWVPRLAGKTDLIPNHPNSMWIDPRETGVYLGQCSQYCGVQHAKMLLRVYVQTRDEFDRWLEQQSGPAAASDSTIEGRRTFESTACVNCHTIRGSTATGTFGPDLTHLMSRETIGAGAALNTPANLRRWIQDPSAFKPGCLMPAMGLSDSQLDAITAYMETLR